MVLLEWSHNEGCLKKLERLAFALVRTRPPKEPGETRKKNLWIEKCKGLAGPFALTLLVTIPYVAENTSGPIIVASLLLSAINTCFAVWCYNDFECNHGHCTGDIFTCIFTHVGEFPAFLIGWWRIQAYCAGLAASSRTLSCIIDSVTGRHVETFMENIFGSFTPLGAPMDIMAVGVTFVPTVMCTIGMEESNFIRTTLFLLVSLTTTIIFGSALATSHLLTTVVDTVPTIQDRNVYSKILLGASLASTGFLGIHKICRPDNLTLTQHSHFQVLKKFSLTGCVICSTAFLFYFIESTVLNKVQPTSSIWAGDPPLLWPLEGGWRLAVASLGIAALSLATFEFLIPLCNYVTKLANDGLLYRNLQKQVTNLEDSKWNLITPLFFGGVTAFHALLLDTKVLIGIMSSALMCIYIIISASMLAIRYQTGNYQSSYKKNYLSRTRRLRGSHGNGNNGNQVTIQTRRLMTVSFLKSGLSKIPKEIVNEIDGSRSLGNTNVDITNDRTYLMDDVAIAPIESRDSTDFSIGSGVSGYESDSDPYPSEDANETDVDAAVTEYQERIRVATLNGTLPMNPTPATARRVSLATMALVPCCIALASSLNRPPKGHLIGILLAVSSGLLTFLLLVVISRQPQKKEIIKHSKSYSNNGNGSTSIHLDKNSSTIQNFFIYSMIPWVPAFAIFIHSCLLLEALDLAATPFAFWLSSGLIIYFSYGVTKSIAAPPSIIPTERIKIRMNETTNNQPTLDSTTFGTSTNSNANASTNVGEPYAQINTVVVS